MIRPIVPLLLLLMVGLLCLALMAVIPEQGIGLGSARLKFKTWASLWDSTSTNQPINVTAMLDSLAADSLQTDSLKSDTIGLKVIRKQGITSIQFKDGDSSPLFPFFEALEASGKEGTNIHVLHYGDSQIESDRMSGYLRQQWQEKFGGRGPGLIAPVPVTASANISQSQSSNWKRYTAYGYDNGKSPHNRYGIMAAYGRFTDPTEGSMILPGADTLEGWIELRPSRIAHSHSKSFSLLRLYFGYHQRPVELTVQLGDSIVDRQVYPADGTLVSYTRNLGSTPDLVRIVFRGQDSPDVQGIVLESAGGVHVDNLALRGSNGNIFRRIDERDINRQISDLNAKLIILQFGGNSVPYITGSKGAEDYARFFQSQIRYLKKLAPAAAFMVIGPSDMSTSVDGVYQSWPGVKYVRDAMKKIAFEEGCGFWDLYEVMGGENSMVSWVTSDPPYAGPDYTHFTPLGARKSAELLYRSMQAEFDAWQSARSQSSEKINSFK